MSSLQSHNLKEYNTKKNQLNKQKEPNYFIVYAQKCVSCGVNTACSTCDSKHYAAMAYSSAQQPAVFTPNPT